MDNKIKKPKEAVLAANALGELYQIGLSGLLSSVVEGETKKSIMNK